MSNSSRKYRRHRVKVESIAEYNARLRRMALTGWKWMACGAFALLSALALAILIAVPLHAQRTTNTFNVYDFRLSASVQTVGSMTTAAQAQCNASSSYPCIIIFDPILSQYPTGTMPAKCAQCTWIDYRSGMGGATYPVLTTADDCAAINAAAIAAGANGVVDARAMLGARSCTSNPFSGVTGKITFLTGPGTFQATVKWTYPPGFKWIGQGTKLSQGFSGDHLMQEAAPAVGSDDVEITGVTFDGLGTATGFALIHIRGQRYFIHQNVFTDTGSTGQNTTLALRIEGCASNGTPAGCTGALAVNGGIVSDNVFQNTRWISISLATNVNSTTIRGNSFNNTFAFLDLNGDSFNCDGTVFSGNTVNAGAENSAIQSVTGTSITGNTFINQTAGLVSNSGVFNVTAVSNNQKELVISGNTFDGNAESAISILNNVSYFSITGNIISRNGKDGISLNLASPNISGRGTISGNQFRNNGTSNAAGGFAAIRAILPGTASLVNMNISGNQTFDDQGTPSQTYGLSLTGAGTVVGMIATGNDFANNKTGAINLGITPTNSCFLNKEANDSNLQLRLCSVLPDGTAINLGSASLAFPNGFLTNWVSPGVAFASLGTPANGTFVFCNNCTVANPCAAAGTGALAKRLNGAWVCN